MAAGGVRKGLCRVRAGVGSEGAFQRKKNACFVERSDPAIAFSDRELLALKRVQLHQLELAIELFVQHIE